MTTHSEAIHTWKQQCRSALVIVKKNAMLYYLRPPVVMFGVLFPVFFFLTFKLGRPIPAENIVPGMVAMALWFTASAVGPLVTPWERAARTYERLIGAPLHLRTIIGGDVLSGLLFGVCLSFVPVLIGLAFTDAAVAKPGILLLGIVLGALAFASLGVLLAAPPANSPSNIMLLSNLVRLPLLFVSGVFLPIAQMPVWARWVAPLSPLSYAGGLIRSAFGEHGYFPDWLSAIMLLVFAAAFFWGACVFHRRGRAKGL